MINAGGKSLKLLAGAGAAFFALSFASSAFADDRYSAIVMNARTGEVLLEDQADSGRFPASLTKMMTLYMLFEAMERGDLTLDSRMTASRHSASQPPSRLGLRCTRRRGCDSINVDQAIRALAVQSANDVAATVAERLGGSESRFAGMMTSRARELGMTDTRFVNASGLPDPRQQTTARDMARLSQALWRDFPQYYHYFQTESFAWRRASGRNHNHLLGAVEGVDGIKTGYTRASGFNLASMAERGGQRVIVVVMGGETAAARDAQVAYLIDGAFEEYARRTDPSGVTYANLPTHRLDVRIAPGALGGGAVVTAVTSTPAPAAIAAAPAAPASPYAAYQSMVLETLAPRPASEAAPAGQGDDNVTDESEPGDTIETGDPSDEDMAPDAAAAPAAH